MGEDSLDHLALLNRCQQPQATAAIGASQNVQLERAPQQMRSIFAGQRRFDQMQTDLGLSRAILTNRLNRVVKEGLLEKVAYSQRPKRYEYKLTDKGRAFWPVLASLFSWGQDWMSKSGQSPVVMIDSDTGAEVRPEVVDATTGQKLDVRPSASSRALRAPDRARSAQLQQRERAWGAGTAGNLADPTCASLLVRVHW